MRKLAIALLLLCSTTAFAKEECRPRGRGYAYALGNGHLSFATGTSLSDLVAAKKRFGDDFFWARIHGRSYVILDTEFLQRVRKLFAPIDALSPEIERISREEEKLDEELDKMSDGPDHLRDEARMEELRKRLEVVHRKERELDKREDALSCEAEKKMWPMVEDAIRNGLARRL